MPILDYSDIRINIKTITILGVETMNCGILSTK
jgi:hypothetical protein